MSKKDLYSDATVTQCFSAASLDADANGTSIDLKSHQSALFVATVGVGGITFSTSNKIEFELEESADDSTFTDVAAADMEGEDTDGDNAGCFGRVISAATDDAAFVCQYHGSKRYVRPVAAFTGTHGTATPISVIGIAVGNKYRS